MSPLNFGDPKALEVRALRRLTQQAQGTSGNSFAQALEKATQTNDDPVLLRLGKPGEKNYLEIRQSHLTDRFKQELGKLEKASEGLEAMMLKQLFGQMQKSAPGMAQGPYADLANDLFTQNLAEQTAGSKGVGIADAVFRQLSDVLLRQAAAEMKANPSKDNQP